MLDLEGKVCGQRGFAHCGKGLHEMIDWIVNTTGAPAEKVGVVIETARTRGGVPVGSWVRCVFNQSQTDGSIPGPFQRRRAKDDRLDARVLAENVWTAISNYMPEVVHSPWFPVKS